MKSYDISNSNQEENTSYFILSHGGVAVHFQIDMGALIIRYWGPHVDIKEEDVVSQDEYPSFLFSKSIPYSDFDHRLHPGIMREHSRGWLGHPTIQGHRKNGCDWSTQFHVQTASLRQQDSQEGSSSESTSTDQHFHVHLYDDSTYLSLYMTYILNSFGVLKITYELVNNHPEQEEVYYLQNLIYWLPLPHHVTETLDFYGHWSKERIPQRHKQIPVGCWMRESWEGRPGHSYTIGTLAMTSGTTFAYGDVWSVALAYSGNSRYWIEKTYMGITSIGVEEILFPGEVILQSKQSYLAPPVLAVYSSQGLDGSAHVYHEYLRSLYKRRRPSIPFHRPMTLNLWEAIYFQHDPDRIRKIVDAAVEIGVERIVLDDGWFSSRRNDTSGLGDWMISEDVYPNHTLDHISQYIISKGIQFGLWFEGEMVNVDSNVFRQHPDWIMDEKGRIVTNTTSTKSTSVSWRHQYVLNLAHPDAFTYLLESISTIISRLGVSYIKWDHNRVLVNAGYRGRPTVRQQTLALYQLLGALRLRHPQLDIESCASGGARIDLGIFNYVDRFWTSDCNDALERQMIQRWTMQFIPPELLGFHFGNAPSHQTNRVLSLPFRAITALFGHAGLECDITQFTREDQEAITRWISYYKDKRFLLHSGTMVSTILVIL